MRIPRPALALLRAHVKLLALVDIDEECGRLRLIELVAVAQLRGVEQVAQADGAVEKIIDPARLQLRPFGIGRIELPSAKKRLDQLPERLGSRIELQHAPAAAKLRKSLGAGQMTT